MPQQGGINAPYTRLRGPLLVGQSSDFSIAAVNGGSTAPLLSFWNASEHGFFVNSSASVTQTVPGGSYMTYTSALAQMVSTGMSFSLASTQAGFLTTAATVGYLIIPQSTGIMSSGATPSNLNGGVALVWANSSGGGSVGKLWAYSTVSTGWMASTAPFWSSTST